MTEMTEIVSALAVIKYNRVFVVAKMLIHHHP